MNDYKENLLSTVLLINNERDLEIFLKEILNESEFKNLITTWSILNEIKKNTPHRKIVEMYNTSLAKINKSGKILKDKNSFIKKILDKRFDESSI